ncbi:MAG: MBL fold metallo-hydrolase [Cyclobacteriaceae bacterium]|nr:MBL fold metallo-hydrolase [Cyclobacteriaceae bacterium]
MIHIQTFIFGPFQENTYIIHDHSGVGAIFDPGCYEKSEQDQLLQYVEAQNIKIDKVINTHCHIDHVLGNEFVKKHFQAPLLIPALEDPVLKAVQVYAASYGFPQYQEAEVDEFLSEEDELVIGETPWKILFVPGHSPGHLAFYQEEAQVCLGGDVLFNGSIGRTDLPGGDYQTLIDSIHQKIFALDDDVTVYSGHGPSTTVGHEKQTNPFCAIS